MIPPREFHKPSVPVELRKLARMDISVVEDYCVRINILRAFRREIRTT